MIYHGQRLLDGARDFVDWLKKENKNFLFLTNSSERSPAQLHDKLLRMGVDVDESHFMTSALATASFLCSQMENRVSFPSPAEAWKKPFRTPAVS